MATVLIIKMTETQAREQGIDRWPIWEKGVSRFDWTYDGEEQCYFLEGEVVIETDKGNFNIGPGDFVTFQDGLKCVWDIRKGVRKHYNFK